ncbi:hypothetical protein [Plasmodium yoelii yoelii]|uniref:PRELI/MSF1 domain-containing protein n=1 Tax=Plasmodium yoelii yoelii TaxID=73239 RepID=Q7RL31_PLAYO|nr:hypothetical protein [Plasmodium yoelii yoelii]
MKNFEQEHMYHYDWGTVTAAYWNKYPNLVQNHIKGIDVIDRKIDIDNQTMKLKRIVHLQYFIPKIFNNNTFYKQSTQINITGLGYMKNLIENNYMIFIFLFLDYTKCHKGKKQTRNRNNG